MFKSLVYQLFSQLAVGGLLSIALVPFAAGKSFFRFCCITCIGLLALAILAGPFSITGILVEPATGIGIVVILLCLSSLLAVIFLATVLRENKKFQKPFLVMSGIIGAIAMLVAGYHDVPNHMPVWAHLFGASYSLISALFLGSVIFAMILGHWYLVLPTLPIDPLRSLTLLMIITITGKLVLGIVTAYVYWSSGDSQIRQALLSFLSIRGIFLWARILFGLLGPIVLSYMIWETVKINSTQSATGLLYVATVFVLLGETLSKYLFYTTSIPI